MEEVPQDLKDKAVAYLSGAYRDAGDVVPSIEGMACFIGKSCQTVYRWRNIDEAFRDTLESIKTAQARLLINGGLLGDYNPTITKLMMSNHGYSDKVDNTSSDGSMTPKAVVLNKAEFADVAREVVGKV